MNYSNLLKISGSALLRNKMRSLLTMLGIIIGVASVIAMLGIGQGSKQASATPCRAWAPTWFL
jgi:putative ABC transport system permease protein